MAKPEARATKADHERDAWVFKSLRRILCQFPIGEDTTDYVKSIQEQVRIAGISPEDFDAACIRVAGSMLPYKPPMAAEYLEAARAIKAQRTRRREDCKSCNGRGWIYVKDLRDPAGEKEAVATCQACKPVGA